LARAGVGSRREAEALISDGLVTVNGKKIKLGDQAEAGKDAIKVRGKLLQIRSGKTEGVYYAFYKPRSVICMMTPDAERSRKTLLDFFGSVKTRLFPVGRMDYNGEGLVLLTNDGEFNERVQAHKDILRFYIVKIKGHMTEEMLERLKRGARVMNKDPRKGSADRFIKPIFVRVTKDLKSKSKVELIFKGMGALDVKEYVQSRGFLVERVVRTGIGQLTVKGMMPGTHKLLKKSQVLAILDQPELAERLIPKPLDPTRGPRSKKPQKDR